MIWWPLIMGAGIALEAGLELYEEFKQKKTATRRTVAHPTVDTDNQPETSCSGDDLSSGMFTSSHTRNILRAKGVGLAETLSRIETSLRTGYVESKAALHTWHNGKVIPMIQNAQGQYVQARDTIFSAALDDDSEQAIHRKLVLSIAMIGLAAGGQFVSPWMTLLSVPGLIYLSLTFVWRGYDEVVKQRKIGMGLLDSALTVLLFGIGQFLAMALFFGLYYISRVVLLKTQDTSKNSLMSILSGLPHTVWIEVEGVEVQIPFEDVRIGDIVVVHAGEAIPVDGEIVDGIGSIDQRALTGEAQPVEKSIGDRVFASTMILSGRILIQVVATGEATVAASIENILANTADYRVSLQVRGDRIADQSVLPTFALSAVALPLLGPISAAAVMCAPFGYNMRIIAPISVLNFLHLTSEQGILVKDGRALEQMCQIDTVVFDKTGTLTQDQPHVAAIHTCLGCRETDVLRFAATAEYRQTHPIARAILQEAQTRRLNTTPVEETVYEVGYGLRVTLPETYIRVGSLQFMMMERMVIPPELTSLQDACHEQGATLVYVALNDRVAGAIELHPTIRPEASRIILALRQRGLRIAILSGDHERPTRQLAGELGIDEYFAETLPTHKADVIAQLQQAGRKVCFVGDGINDVIALKTADVSISLRGASTIATDTAQIILTDASLTHLPAVFDLARSLDRNMKYNLALTMIPGVICLGGVYFLHFGVIAATLVYNAGLAAGVFNAMLPALSARDRQPHQSENSTEE